MLMNIANLWNEFYIFSVAIYIVALICFGMTYIATETEHLIIGAIVALITGFFAQISKILFNIGTFLFLIRLVLFFI